MSESTPAVPSPDAIVNLAVAHMSAKQLRIATRIGLFRALAPRPHTAAELASELGIPERVVRILADGMSAAGLLERRDGHYANTPEAAAYLAQDASTEHDLGPLLSFFEDFSYPQWLQFEQTARTGEPGELDTSGERWEPFLAGVMNYNALHGALLPRYVDFGAYHRMLDLGGLCEYFVLGATAANPELRVDVVVEQAFEPALAAAIDSHELADRVSLTASPATEARVEPGHDLVLLAHVLHRFTAEENARILTTARAAAEEGARLLILDFVLDEDGEQRPLDAWMAGEYLVIDGTTVYPEEQVRTLLAESGWRLSEKIALPGSPRLLLADAI